MNYVQDFVNNNLCELLQMGILSGCICAVLILLVIHIFQELDKELVIDKKGRTWCRLILLWILLGSVMFIRFSGNFKELSKVLIMLIYLAVCSITDYYIQQVYDCFQIYVCCVIGCLMISIEMQPSLGVELLIFALIQRIMFYRMYGDADTMGFLICALSLADGGLFVWILHMAFTFLFLGIVQYVKKNIGVDGNLKAPVPLFPYIMAAYIFVFWNSSCADFIFLVS